MNVEMNRGQATITVKNNAVATVSRRIVHAPRDLSSRTRGGTRSADHTQGITYLPKYAMPCGKPQNRTPDRVLEAPSSRTWGSTPTRKNTTRKDKACASPTTYLPSARDTQQTDDGATR